MPRYRASIARREREKTKRSERRRAERTHKASSTCRVLVSLAQEVKSLPEVGPEIPPGQPKTLENPDLVIPQRAACADLDRRSNLDCSVSSPELDDCLQIDGYEFVDDHLL